MSGPIVRRYGFPNFDKIFGEKPMQHGAEETSPPSPHAQAESEAATSPTSKTNESKSGATPPKS